MAFGNYTSIDDVIRRHRIKWQSGTVVEPATDAPPFSDAFRSEMAFNIHALPPVRSEAGAGEIFLFPILREVWRTYCQVLSFFTHEELHYDNDLTGIPDYFICKRSEFGPFYPEPPYLLVVEAKLDDFEKAWGQCLAEMLAAQKINQTPDRPVYGIATNGRAWEFGMLQHSVFTRQLEAIGMADLQILSQALHSILRQCASMAQSHTPATTP